MAGSSVIDAERGELVVTRWFGAPRELVFAAVTFSERDGGTEATLRHHLGFPPPAELRGANQGWTESFDRLVEYLGDA